MSESEPVPRATEKEIFFAALDLDSAPERLAYLDRACAGSSTLRGRVEALLAEHAQSGDFMRSPALDSSTIEPPRGAGTRPTPVEPSSPRVGRYRLLEKIGEGGFGEVWMAEQREPVKRRVALKLIKPGMDSKQVVARFEAERQALALMDHPNIARILDAGTTDGAPQPGMVAAESVAGAPELRAGRPYFVMELVRGTRITDFCDQNQLSTFERLTLFIQVCQAIQHAHQKGVIHRDIKPSNILVTLQDGVPVPKVIDFGIAKALQQELTEQTLFTQFQQFIGTPAYISPEQADPAGVDVDTRADIYSLGVLLYELLVGQTPFDAREMVKGGLEALRETIRQKEPLKPSTRLKTMAPATRTSAAEHRRTEVVALSHQLRGDLDWIVLKCLEKDRSRRYDTAHGLAADLRRHLANEPVVARPPGTFYRLGKAWRRNRLAFSAAAVVMLAVAGFLVSTVVFSVKFGQEQQRTALILRSRLAAEYLHRGQNLCLEGKVTEGLHWLARSLRDAPIHDSNLIAAARQNLGGWSAARHQAVSIYFQNGLLYAAAYSPVEDLVALGGMENSVQLYSAATGDPAGPVLPHDRVVGQAVFSPDGRFLATVDGAARLWDVAGRRLMFPAFSSGDVARRMAFSPDSRRIVVAYASGVIRQWSVDNGQELGRPMEHQGLARDATYSPDGRLIATCGGDRTARLWGAASGEPAGPRFAHDESLARVAFSPDGRFLACQGTNRSVWIWSVARGAMAGQPVRHNGVVTSMAFSPDSLRLVTGCDDGTARLWTLAGDPVGSPMRHEGGVRSVAFTPDGRRVLTGGRDRAARFWSAEAGESAGQPLEHDGWVDELCFNRDGSKVLGRTYGHSAAVWSASPRTPADVELREQPLLGGVFSPDGRQVLTGNILGEVRLWSAITGEPSGVTVTHTGRLWNVAFHPDGSRFLTAGRDGRVQVWSAVTGEPDGPPLVHSNGVRAAVFSHDGTRVATACFDGAARVWSLATREVVGPPMFHPKAVEDVDFSPDDRRIVTAGGDGFARVWSVGTGRIVLPLMEHRSAVLGAVFSPDGRRILTGSRDATARLWDASTGLAVGQPMPHPDWVEEVAFSPDGRMILTGSNDGGARLWSVAGGDLLGPPVWHHGPLMDVQFSPDGRKALCSCQAKAFWEHQGPAFRGARLWTLPGPFAGSVESAERRVESETGMTLDGRGVLSRLEPAAWRSRKAEFSP